MDYLFTPRSPRFVLRGYITLTRSQLSWHLWHRPTDPQQIQISRQSNGEDKNTKHLGACILANQRWDDRVEVVTFTDLTDRDRALPENSRKLQID